MTTLRTLTARRSPFEAPGQPVQECVEPPFCRGIAFAQGNTRPSGEAARHLDISDGRQFFEAGQQDTGKRLRPANGGVDGGVCQ
jgi:hypothetical protein